MKKRGFTLVELLVVVAVIGLLASIIIVSLNTARNRAKNTAIKQALSELRIAAEWEYDQVESYVNVCVGTDINSAAGTNFARIRQSIRDAGGPDANRTCRDNGSNKWCAEQENMPNGGGWCVDYLGYSGSIVVCDATNYDCASP